MPTQLFRYRFVKRSMDIGLVLIAMPVLLPLFGAIAIALMVTSPGPVFFSHRRIRKNGAFFFNVEVPHHVRQLDRSA